MIGLVIVGAIIAVVFLASPSHALQSRRDAALYYLGLAATSAVLAFVIGVILS